MGSPEKGGIGSAPTRVEFFNQPQERSADLAQAVAGFIIDDAQFNGEKVQVEFPQTGGASFVSILTTGKEKKERMVFKVTSKSEYSTGESFAFQAWEAAGAKVPHIYKTGTLDVMQDGELKSLPFVIMSFIDGKPLKESKSRDERLNARSYWHMGRLLRRMHRSKGKGNGLINEEGTGQFKSFNEWLTSEKMQRDTARVVEKGYIDADTIMRASEVLAAYAAEHPESTFCHMDFASHNIFDTEPLTVFDPGAELNISYIDIGKALVCNMEDGEEAMAQLIEGYEAEDDSAGIAPEKLDPKVLHAAFIMSGLRKLVFFDKNPTREDVPGRLAAMLKYLADNKHYLDS